MHMELEETWITEWLLGRVQRVVINGTRSERSPFSKGQSWDQFYLKFTSMT